MFAANGILTLLILAAAPSAPTDQPEQLALTDGSPAAASEVSPSQDVILIPQPVQQPGTAVVGDSHFAVGLTSFQADIALIGKRPKVAAINASQKRSHRLFMHLCI